MTYPQTPGFQSHSDTSRRAADECQTINTMEGQILDRLSITEVGWTADELHQHLETLWPDVQSGTVAARLRGLQLKGKIVKGAAERKTRSGRMANEWWLKEYADLRNVTLAESAPPPVMTATEAELRRRLTTLELFIENKLAHARRFSERGIGQHDYHHGEAMGKVNAFMQVRDFLKEVSNEPTA